MLCDPCVTTSTTPELQSGPYAWSTSFFSLSYTCPSGSIQMMRSPPAVPLLIILARPLTNASRGKVRIAPRVVSL